MSWRASWFRLVAKCLRNGGSSKRFFSRSSRSSWSRIRVASRVTSASGSMPWRRMIDTGNALRLLEDRREEVGRLDGVAAAAARVQQRQLEEQLGRRRDAQLAARHARQQPQVLFERLQDLVRVQLEVAHDLAEHVPFGLRERQADVLVGQERVLAAAGLVERAVDDALGRLGQLVLRNVEVFHGALHALSLPARDSN